MWPYCTLPQTLEIKAYRYELHACECVLLLATLKCTDAENSGYICYIVFPLLSLVSCVLPVLRLYVSLCVRERDRVKPRAPNPNATNRRCYDPPETMKRGTKSKMVMNGQCGSILVPI